MESPAAKSPSEQRRAEHPLTGQGGARPSPWGLCLGLLVVLACSFETLMAASAVPSPREIGRGEAGFASPSLEDALFYNPAALAISPAFTAFSLQYHYNALGHALPRRYRQIDRLKQEPSAQLAAIAALIGRNQYLAARLLAVHHTGQGLSFGLHNSVDYEGIIRGRVLPLADAELAGRLQAALAWSLPLFNQQLAVGVSLKPSYKINYQLFADALAFFEDKELGQPLKRAKEGVGLGVDTGVGFGQQIGEHRLQLAASLSNAGDLTYRPYKVYGTRVGGAPPRERARLGLGASFASPLGLPYLNKVEVHGGWAGLLKPAIAQPLQEGLRMGLSFSLLAGIEAHLGVYGGYPTYGVLLPWAQAHLAYAFYHEYESGRWQGRAGHQRHLWQLTLKLP